MTRRLAFSVILWLVLVVAAVPVLTSLPYGVEMVPIRPQPLSERDQHRAVAVATHAVSHGCRTTEPYPPHDEQRSALVEDAPGEIRLTSIDEGRAVLEGRMPGVLLAVCER